LRVSFEPACAARAEPSGVEASRLEARETLDTVLIGSGSAAAALGVDEAGEPQTSQ
jgi:hypothetical protein